MKVTRRPAKDPVKRAHLRYKVKNAPTKEEREQSQRDLEKFLQRKNGI